MGNTGCHVSKDNREVENILYVQHELTRQGSSLSLYYLIRELDLTRFKPIVVCSKKTEEMSSLYKMAGAEVISGNTASYIHIRESINWLKELLRLIRFLVLLPHSIIALRNIMKKMNIALVHVNSSAIPAAAIAAKTLCVPVVWHIREVVAYGRFGIRKKVLEWLIDRCADEVIAISNDEAGAIKVKKKVVVINNAVDFKIFDRKLSGAGFRKEFAVSSDAVCVGTIASVDPSKGIYEFIEAARIIKPGMHIVKFFIVGSQFSESRNKWLNLFLKIVRLEKDHFIAVKEMIHKYGLDDDVCFTGSRNDIPSVIAAMDLIVCPYRLFAIGRPAIEAAAMGKPVVAASTNLNNGIVIDRETGLLFPHGDYHKLANSVLEILRDSRKAAAMGENAFNHAKRNFNAEINTGKIMGIYENIA